MSRMRRSAYALLAVAGAALLTGPASASTDARFVLPPTAAAPLRSALVGDGRPLDERLTLQSALLSGDHAVIRFGPEREGATALAVTLRHPSAAGADETTGPFALERAPGPIDEAALTALRGRLAALEADSIWLRVTDGTGAGGPEEARPVDDPPPTRQPDARRALKQALHAAVVTDGAAAGRQLEALSADPALRRAAGLDLAEAWHRIGRPDAARSAVEAWSADTAEPTASEAARAAILAGDARPVAAIRAALPDAERCHAATLARSLEVAGRPADARALLEAARDDARCPGIGMALADWHFERRAFDAAAAVTAALLAVAPEDEGVVGQRARVLMALGRPQEAAELLEPIAFRQADSGLVSALLGALNRVPDRAWVAAKRDALLVEANVTPNAHAAAFVAGVLLHYEGDFARSQALLSPLLDVFGEQPRLFIYLGMNAFNLGRRDEALAWIQRAAELDAPDPDVYYCRAEILRWSDPAAALADLRRYLAQTATSPTTLPRKQQRVERMAELLAACVEGGDPIPCSGPWEHPRGDAANTDPAHAAVGERRGWPWAAAAALVVLVFAGVALIRRRRT